MEELEIKHLTPYLPYGLYMKVDDRGVLSMDSMDDECVVSSYNNFTKTNYHISDIKPILRPLSSMTKKEAYDILCLIVGIEDIGFEQSDLDYISLNYEYDMLKIKGEFPFDDYVCGTEYTINISNDGIACFDTGSNGMYITHSAYDYLFSKHFDIFGLIDEGLAIEKNIDNK